ncbi:MAG: hypothetical protein WAQ98_31510 [Blastocatellia bacterium]
MARKFYLSAFALILMLNLAFINSKISFVEAAQDPSDGPFVDKVSANYREAKKDPFLDEKRVIVKDNDKVIAEPSVNVAVAPPSFEERDAAWKVRRLEANKKMQPSPLAIEKYLVDEVKVLGIYQKVEGQGVFLKPSTSTTIFAMVGDKFWNGQIKSITKDKIEVEVTTVFINGKKKSEIQSIPFTRGK